MEIDTIKLLTFNVWGLKYISKHRRARIEGIVKRLRDPAETYDVIALQEVWCQEDWNCIDEGLKDLYPYTRYFKSGIIAGPGLAVLSKIPIESSWLYRFPINGTPAAVNRGDFYVGKSLAITTLTNNVVILNSHMHAPYSLTGHDAYACTRACQAWDIMKLVNLLKKAGYHIIFVGDLNSRPDSLPHKLFTYYLKDSWEVLKTQENALLSNEQVQSLTPKDQILMGGITCDSQLNSFRSHRQRHEACRLDYALISESLVVVDAHVRFVDELPSHKCSYSDHFAYYVKVKFKEQAASRVNEDVELVGILQQLIAEIEVYVSQTLPRHYTWKRTVFYLSTLTILLTMVFGFVVPSPVLAVLLPLLAIVGVISGIISVLWVSQESRNMEEVKTEARDQLNRLLRGSMREATLIE